MTYPKQSVTKPSDVYHTQTKENIENFVRKESLRILDFRPARHGEKYLGASGGNYVMDKNGPSSEFLPRFIVEYLPPREQFPKDWWE